MNRKPRRAGSAKSRVELAIVSVIAILLVVGVAIWQFQQAPLNTVVSSESAQMVAAALTPNPADALTTPSATPSAVATLPPPGPPPTFPAGYPPGKKAAVLNHYQQALRDYNNAAKAGRNVRPSKQPPALPSSPQQLPTGIIDHALGPFEPSEFLISNAWQGVVDGRRYEVFAGELGNGGAANSQPQTGAVRVYTLSISADNSLSYTDIGTFPASAATAQLTVTSFSGAILTLSSENGQMVTFDVLTDQFTYE